MKTAIERGNAIVFKFAEIIAQMRLEQPYRLARLRIDTLPNFAPADTLARTQRKTMRRSPTCALLMYVGWLHGRDDHVLGQNK